MSQGQVNLLAEDNRGDVLLAQRAFRHLSAEHLLYVVEHGDAVIDYLTGVGDYAERDRYPLPNVLLLDLKMPRRSGFEVMEWLQQQPDLQIPIVILTTSTSHIEIERAYSLGASFYIVKPITLKTLAETLTLVQQK
jgi:CheY-like chemotaxis protein